MRVAGVAPAVVVVGTLAKTWQSRFLTHPPKINGQTKLPLPCSDCHVLNDCLDEIFPSYDTRATNMDQASALVRIYRPNS